MTKQNLPVDGGFAGHIAAAMDIIRELIADESLEPVHSSLVEALDLIERADNLVSQVGQHIAYDGLGDSERSKP
jgi:hypothetical protein